MNNVLAVTMYQDVDFQSYRAMLYNEDDYPDPSAFKPERFIKDGQLDPNIRDPSTVAFGFGRRWGRTV